MASPPLCQEQLNVAQAEAEHMIQPDRMADVLRWEAMAIVRIGWRLHAPSFVRLPRGYQTPVIVTIPAQLLFSGRYQEARPALGAALRFDPSNLISAIPLTQVALSYYLEGNYPESANAERRPVIRKCPSATEP